MDLLAVNRLSFRGWLADDDADGESSANTDFEVFLLSLGVGVGSSDVIRIPTKWGFHVGLFGVCLIRVVS